MALVERGRAFVAGEERKGSPEAGSDEASGADGGGVTESGEEGNSNGAEDIAKGDPKAGEIDASADGTSENAPESTDSYDSPPPAAGEGTQTCVVANGGDSGGAPSAAAGPARKVTSLGAPWKIALG